MLNNNDNPSLFSRFDTAFAEFLNEKEPSNDPRLKILASLVSHLFSMGHTCLDLNLLATLQWDALGLDEDIYKLLPKNLCDSVKSMPWKFDVTSDEVDNKTSPLVLDNELLYLRKNWEAEKRIIKSIKDRLAVQTEVAPTLSMDLQHLFGTDDSYAQPDWQKLACAVATNKLFTLITGGPGTGKTTTVTKLLALLASNAKKQNPPQAIRIALTAPTGKAAARLGASIKGAVDKLPAEFKFEINQKPVTLHKLLKIRPSAFDSQITSLAYDVIVVDEASMISLSLMDRLLECAQLETRLIFLGDQDQLASVEAGAVLGQLCLNAVDGNYLPATIEFLETFTSKDLSAWAGSGSPLAQQTVMLRKSHRSQDGGVINQWAQLINNGDVQGLVELRKLFAELSNWSQSAQSPPIDHQSQNRRASNSVGNCGNPIDRLNVSKFNSPQTKEFLRNAWTNYLDLIKNTHFDATQDNATQQLLATQILEAFGEFQLLCAVREGPWGVNQLNKVIAQLLGFKDEGWYVGRPVMVTRNNSHLDLRNGDIGICLERNGVLRVAFPSGVDDNQEQEVDIANQIRWILPSRLDSVESVFAMTVHKSQGSEFDHVCLVIPETRTAVLTRELIYTGLTRAKKRVTWITPDESILFKAIETRMSRSGGLHVLHNTKGN